MNPDKLMETIKAVEPGHYDLLTSETRAIITASPNGGVGMVYDAYRYGFLKGQRSQRAAAKKRAQEKEAK